MLWKSHNEVHCDLLKGEGSFFGRNSIEGHFWVMCEDFVLLTGCVSFDVV